MQDIIFLSANYLIIILMSIYTIKCFTVFRHSDAVKQNRIFVQQNILMFIIHFIAYAILFLKNPDEKLLLYYGMQFVLILFILLMYNAVYPESSRLIINNMCMLIIIGCIYISSINSALIIRHFIFIFAGILVSVFIPFIIKKINGLRNIWYIYAFIGIAVLLTMRLFSKSLGAHIEVKLLGISMQPQEFIKILYVFMIAAIYDRGVEVKRVILCGILSAAHVLILVWNNDLGVALILAFVYVVMTFIATKNSLYFISGVIGAGVSFGIGYKLFTHVQNRVAIWLDPWQDYLGVGYQIVMALFAIANGGWFGVGLGNGQAKTIPIVTSDLMIIPIIEESGLIFAIFLILVCVSCFVMFLNISSVLDDMFYKLLALGLGATYIVQVLLTVGGSVKFIPMTGVTLPLISYGGSSMLATIIAFSIIQGLYVIYGIKRRDISKHRRLYEKRKSEKKPKKQYR